jgi:hypothetical protein
VKQNLFTPSVFMVGLWLRRLDMSEVWEVIEAFADGEPVDPDELKRALAVEPGRAHLVEVLALRGVVAGPGVARPLAVVPRHRPLALTLRRALAVAALVVLSVAGGYVAGRRDSVPEPIQPQQTVTGATTVDSIAAPAPTRVIRLEHGVDWDERKGGN